MEGSLRYYKQILHFYRKDNCKGLSENLRKVFVNDDIHESSRPAIIHQHQDHIKSLILCLQFLSKVLDDLRPNNDSAGDHLCFVNELNMVSVSPVCLQT